MVVAGKTKRLLEAARGLPEPVAVLEDDVDCGFGLTVKEADALFRRGELRCRLSSTEWQDLFWDVSNQSQS